MADTLVSTPWLRRHTPPAPVVIVTCTAMFLAGLAGAAVAVLADKLADRFLNGGN